MLMGEDTAPHDGQIRIGAQEIMGELFHKGQELCKGAPVDNHGHMPAIEHDAMLVIVNVGGILQPPVLPRHLDGDDPQVLPGGEIHPARIPSFSMHSIQAG